MTQVTLTGENFNESCTITFGAEPATNIVFVSPTEMTCDAPPQPAGTVDVTITDGITTSTLVAAYEYVPQINYEGWDTSSLPSGVVESKGGYKLTLASGSNISRIVSHNVTRSSGKYSIRLLVNNDVVTQAPGVGITNSSGPTGPYLGSNDNGWSLFGNDSSTNERSWHDLIASNHGDLSTFDSPTEVMIEIDIDAGNLWFGVEGAWVTGNPETGASPTYTGVVGNIHLVADIFYTGSVELLHPSEFVTPATTGFTEGWPS